jgi:hypothetical protein
MTSLPTNIDAVYTERSASAQTHQQHHDEIHGRLNGPLVPVPFSKTGTLITGVGTIRWYNRWGRSLELASVDASVGTAPTGSAIIVDVNKNASTIWSTQANRVQIAISANVGTQSTFNTTTLANGEYLTVDIDQIGSTTAGADLLVTVWLRLVNA